MSLFALELNTSRMNTDANHQRYKSELGRLGLSSSPVVPKCARQCGQLKLPAVITRVECSVFLVKLIVGCLAVRFLCAMCHCVEFSSPPGCVCSNDFTGSCWSWS